MNKGRELSKREKFLLQLLTDQQSYYDCPKDDDGKRLGKLVGYAGTYDTPEGPKQFVGERYWNVPRGAERYPTIQGDFVRELLGPIREIFPMPCSEGIDCMFGCPEGGKIPAFELAREYGCSYSAADKKVTALATETGREQSNLILGRHSVEPGWRVALVEELINNLSTIDKAIKLVEDAGATVVVILCLINRSPDGVIEYGYGDRKIPIFQSVLVPTSEYRQDDPYVADDVAAGRVVWKPKNNWDELIAA